MTNTEIKELLIKMFAADFEIEKHADLNDSNQQSFEYQTGFEFKSNDKWHDSYMNVCGNIYINPGTNDFHNPIGYGDSENQGEPNTISDWDFGEIECYVDSSNAPFMITSSELNQSLNPIK